MIVEFMGMPGSGKTFLATQFIQAENCKKWIDYTYQSYTAVPYKIINKIMRIVVRYLPKYRKTAHELKQICGGWVSKKGSVTDKDLCVFLDDLVYHTFLYHTFSKIKKTNYIFDEGICHKAATIVTLFGIPEEIINKILMLLYDKYHCEAKCVYLKYPIHDTMEAIVQRDRHVCHIDELRGRELEALLSDYQDALELVSRLVKPLVLYRTDELHTNFERIREYIGS